jgi:hypothetical protein
VPFGGSAGALRSQPRASKIALYSSKRETSWSCAVRLVSLKRPSARGSGASSDHAVGERKVCSAPAAHEAPRVAIGARLVPVPFAP